MGSRKEGYVFVNPQTNTRYVKRACIQSFRKAVKRLGLTAVQDGKPVRLTFHDLRHVFATELTDSGANIRDVQRLLGHGSVTVTEIYTAPGRGGSEALKLPR